LLDKDSLIKDFFTTLKISFKNATIYNPEHPAFQKTVTDLMAKVEALLMVTNPIAIGFTTHSLFVDNRFWEGDKTYIELARLFHFRKLKTLEIRQGITADELMRFASKITLPLKEFIREGGAQNVLKKEKILHIAVEELDYSQLLKGEGEEIKEIWPYLMMEAVEENDRQKLEHVAESFEKVVGTFNTEDLIQNEELHKNFAKFFKYLKDTGEEKYRFCARELLKSALKGGKKTAAESKFENLKLLISDLNEKDLASTLWEEIISDDKFDSLSFSVFSKLIAKDRHLKISTSLRELFQSGDPLNRRPEVEEKIRTLLSGTSGKFISEIYRQTLANLLNEISFEKRISFDHQLLQRNYRFVLLNALDKETQTSPAARILERIQEEWARITQDKDLEYLKGLLEVLPRKEKDLAGEPIYQKTRTSISELVENLILEGESSSNLDSFVRGLGESIFDRNVYLERIFAQKRVTSTLLRAYFGFFTPYLFDFNARLKQKASDTRLLEKIAQSLRCIDTPISLVTLKKVFFLGDLPVKLTALKAMQNLTEYDEKFLFSVLETKEMAVKAEALVLLMRNEKTKQAAFHKWLDIESPYGIRNRTIVRHIKVVEEKNLREAEPHLVSLSQRKNFWNKGVREAAARVLEKWSER